MNKQQEPRLRFKGFTGEWKTEGFESVGEFNPKAEIPQIFQYVDLESVVGTQLISYREEFKETAPSRAQRLAKNGDLFFQAVRPYQKNNYLFEKNNENFVFSTGYIQIRPQNDGYFLLTLVQKEEFVQEVLLRCTGTSYPAINTSSLQNIAILIPQTVEEQTHLGLFFRRLDSQIAESRAVLEKSHQLKKAMLAKMFPANGEKIPKIRFKGFEGEWEEESLGKIGEFSAGGDINKEKLMTFGRYPVLANALTNNGIVGFYNNYEFESPAITITGRGDVGIAKARKENFSAVVRLLVLKNKPNYDVDFLEQAINKIDFHTESTGVPQLTVPQCKSYSIHLPSYKEQTAIGNFFRQLDKTIALQAAEVEKLNQLKKGLLAAMLV